jgi:hypothetical protein
LIHFFDFWRICFVAAFSLGEGTSRGSDQNVIESTFFSELNMRPDNPVAQLKVKSRFLKDQVIAVPESHGNLTQCNDSAREVESVLATVCVLSGRVNR